MITNICSISGHISRYNVPINAITKHPLPVYTLSWHAVKSLYVHYQLTGLTDDQTRQLILLLLIHTKRVKFKTHAQKDFNLTAPINCLFDLFNVADFINSHVRPADISTDFANVISNTDNNNLLLIQNWITVWKDNISEYYSSLAEQRQKEQQKQQEIILDRLLLRSNTSPSHAAKLLADWAVHAARFPTKNTINAQGKTLSTSTHWHYCICLCGTTDKNQYDLMNISINDLETIKDWCLANLDYSSVYAFALSRLLTAGIATLKGYTPTTDQLEASQNAQKQFLAMPALTKPEQKDYITLLDYLKAKALYESQQAASNQHSINPFL